MTGKTHIAAAFVVSLYASNAAALPTKSVITLCTCTAVASLLPDIDNCTSKLGRVVAPASIAIQLLFGHRTLFHSPLLYLVAAGALYIFHPEWHLIIIGLLLGTGSHLLLDMLNPAGIPLLYPAKRRFSLGICRSGGILDHLLFAVLTVAAAYLLAHFSRIIP